MRVQLMTEYRLACPLGSRITGKLESERIETDWWGLCWRLLRWIHQRLINSRMTAVLQAVIIVTGHALTMPTNTRSLVGSTQNQVPAAPSQNKVPWPPGRTAAAGSNTTAQL